MQIAQIGFLFADRTELNGFFDALGIHELLLRQSYFDPGKSSKDSCYTTLGERIFFTMIRDFRGLITYYCQLKKVIPHISLRNADCNIRVQPGAY